MKVKNKIKIILKFRKKQLIKKVVIFALIYGVFIFLISLGDRSFSAGDLMILGIIAFLVALDILLFAKDFKTSGGCAGCDGACLKNGGQCVRNKKKHVTAIYGLYKDER